ncbi:MAG: HTH-type transcriptional regulator MhqR [Actinomycetota bacterium]
MTGVVGPAAPREPRRDRVERETFLLGQLVGGQLTTELEAVCREEGLSAAQYPVLWVLCLQANSEGMPQGAISDGLVTQASDVSRLVTRLETSGLVERRQSDTDGRVVLVRPTRLGRAVFERTTERVKRMHRVQFGGLSHAELDQLHDLLNRVFWSPR